MAWSSVCFVMWYMFVVLVFVAVSKDSVCVCVFACWSYERPFFNIFCIQDNLEANLEQMPTTFFCVAEFTYRYIWVDF